MYKRTRGYLLWSAITLSMSQNVHAEPAQLTCSLSFKDKISFASLPVFVSLTISNRSDAPSMLELFSDALPRLVQITVTGPDGKIVRSRKPYYDPGMAGPVIRMRSPDTLHVGEMVNFSYDLNELFSMDQPGRYNIKSEIEGRDPKSYEIELLPLAQVSKSAVEGICVLPLRIVDHPIAHVVLGDVCIEKCDVKGAEGWYAVVRKLILPGGQPQNLFVPIAVPSMSTLEQVDIDCKWQIWAVVKSSDAYSLIVWNILTGEVREVIGKSKEKLFLGVASDTRTPVGKIVTGGTAARKYSSTNLPSR